MERLPGRLSEGSDEETMMWGQSMIGALLLIWVREHSVVQGRGGEPGIKQGKQHTERQGSDLCLLRIGPL